MTTAAEVQQQHTATGNRLYTGILLSADLNSLLAFTLSLVVRQAVAAAMSKQD